MQQQTLDLQGIPSAHNNGKMFYPTVQQGNWTCDCEHFRIHRTPCRHILEKKFNNVKDIYDHISKAVQYNRDIRDINCQDLGEVITYVAVFREFEMNELATLFLNIAILKGEASTDDLHDATGERYANDKIVGVITGALIRDGLIMEVARKATERKCAHGRKIGIYRLTEKGFKVLDARRV